MFELRLLRYFVAVAETEHVGRAAERLHISQSPLSRQIRQLEDQLGLVLFDRERRRFRTTKTGRWFLEEARDLLSHADRLARDADRDARGERRDWKGLNRLCQKRNVEQRAAGCIAPLPTRETRGKYRVAQYVLDFADRRDASSRTRYWLFKFTACRSNICQYSGA